MRARFLWLAPALSLALLVAACDRLSRSRSYDAPGFVDAGSSASLAPKQTPPAQRSPPEPPPGFVLAKVAGVPVAGAGHAVLLVDAEERRALPIFVGGSEGLSIELRLSQERYVRPLTHDLFDNALGRLGTRVDSARVAKLEDGIYFGVLVLVTPEGKLELDSRASDAIAMAIGGGAPIFVAERVFEEAGVPLDSLVDGGLPAPPKDSIAL